MDEGKRSEEQNVEKPQGRGGVDGMRVKGRIEWQDTQEAEVGRDRNVRREGKWDEWMGGLIRDGRLGETKEEVIIGKEERRMRAGGGRE